MPTGCGVVGRRPQHAADLVHERVALHRLDGGDRPAVVGRALHQPVVAIGHGSRVVKRAFEVLALLMGSSLLLKSF